MAKKYTRTQIGQEPDFDHFQSMASGNHQIPRAQVQKGFPSIQGKTSPSSIYPVPKDPGIVHIWYNIPLCTICAQKANVNVSGPNLSSQINHPFLRKIFQSFSLSIPGGYQKTIQGPQPAGPVGFGLLSHLRIIPRVISRGYQSFIQFSRHQVLQYSLDNSIGSYSLYSSNLYGFGPFGPIHIPLWEFGHTVQFSRWPDLC
ncbi:hypothetical protein O181_023162 [Austropuccinia psidii MF-1]|uniref:Uncharacterized protein n=1 Tax=Austropuccinia psidii MF-1 TaxID=1389203 RepID=A0A9Q3GXT1_9BASI|nr:hypothetical protein [Austropuccinia psidii MF-1]